MKTYQSTLTGNLWNCTQVPSPRDLKAWTEFKELYPGSYALHYQSSVQIDVCKFLVSPGDWICVGEDVESPIVMNNVEFERRMVELDEMVVTTQLLPVKQITDAAAEACPETLLVIGYDNDGDLYCASTIGNGPEMLWLLEKCKEQVLADDN